MAVLSALRKRFEDECLHRPVSALPVIGDDGLVLGRGTVLARLAMTRSGEICLAVEADEERVVALLSATYGRPVAPAVMIEPLLEKPNNVLDYLDLTSHWP